MTNEEAIEAIHDKRVDIDSVMELSKKIVHSPATDDARKYLRRAYSWLGKCLGSLPTDYPYPESTNPKSKVIENRVDTADPKVVKELLEKQFDLTPTGAIKSLRAKVDELVNWAEHFHEALPSNKPLNFNFIQVRISLIDAKMMFGWEIGRIHNLPKASNTLMLEKTLSEISKDKKQKEWLVDQLV